jgi:hypothetical protein
LDSGSGLLGDLELDRPARLLLNNGGAVSGPATGTHIIDLQPHEVAAPQLAVDGEIEQSEVASSSFKLEPDADCPNFFRFQRTLLANEPALVPRTFRKANEGWDRGVHGASLIPTAPAAAQVTC